MRQFPRHHQYELPLDYPNANFIIEYCSGWSPPCNVFCDTIDQVWNVVLKLNGQYNISSPTGMPLDEFIPY